MARRLLPVFLVILLLCSCGKSTILLEDTVWKNGNDITVCFYSDGTGYVDADGIKLDFTYILSDGLLTVNCNDTFLAESYGLEKIPLFGTNTVTEDDGYMYIGGWELTQVK